MPASIVIPTRARLPYLEVALASIAPQAARPGAEVLVVDDAGPSPPARALSERFGARYRAAPAPARAERRRATPASQRSRGALVVFVDDDIRVAPGLAGGAARAAATHPDVDVFTGPIQAALEGRAPRCCGRERPADHDARARRAATPTRAYAWGANMAIRRSALERVGRSTSSLEHGGDEQEWQERAARAASPAARASCYVARAAVEHRRAGPDARLRALARAALRARPRGAALRRPPRRAPVARRELRTLAGCALHVLRRRCPAGLTMVAHSAGRLREALARAPGAATGGRIRAAGALATATTPMTSSPARAAPSPASTAAPRARRRRASTPGSWPAAGALRLARAARREPPRRRVLALGIARPSSTARCAAGDRAELARSRHELELRTAAPASGWASSRTSTGCCAAAPAPTGTTGCS